MSVKAIIFDLGGVLVRTEDGTSRTALAQRLGISRAELEQLVFLNESGMSAQRGEIGVDQHWENVCRTLEVPLDELPALQDSFWGGDRLDETLVAEIRKLRQDYQVALLSNAFSDLRHALEHQWGILDAFDLIVVSSEEGITKPDREIYRRVIERLGVKPQEAVFIDDFAHNVEGAQAAGLHAIHFRTPEQALKELYALLKQEA